MMNDEMKNIKESVDETVEEVKHKIDELTAKAEEFEDGEVKEQLKSMVAKSSEVLSNTCNKLVSAAKEFKDSEQLKSAVDFVSTKSKELYEATLSKFDEVKNSPNVQKTMEGVESFFKEAGDTIGAKFNEGLAALKENKDLMNVVNTVTDTASKAFTGIKDSVEGFMSKPEVSEKIDKAKDVTIDVAEKGLDALKNLLKPEDKSSDGDK